MPMDYAPLEINRRVNFRVDCSPIFRLHMKQPVANANIRIESSAQRLAPLTPAPRNPTSIVSNYFQIAI